MPMQGFGKADQILRVHANNTVAWSVNVRDEHEGDGGNKRKDQKQFGSILYCASRTVAEQQVAAMAMATISPQAEVGIRFHKAAWVYPCEFNTSFMPETTRATIGVGCAAAGTWTADHKSVCIWSVRALISC